ncbi:SIS domain-containing protein, partial [Streptococcus pneumoniae]|uniref:SIS domain-containing protein n=1 Tax=Streptococcus pneumoniae TaxID=1313 RepID=UPI0012D70BCD
FQYQHQASKQDTHSHKHSPLTKRVLRSYSIMREHTQDLIDEAQLERVAQLIDDAERVYFFGTGRSGLIAREMKLRFMRLGVVCEALTDQ